MMKPQLLPLFTDASSLIAEDSYRKLTSPTVERELLLQEKPLTPQSTSLVTYFKL